MKRLIFLSFIFCASISFSQNEAAIWYFGQNAGLDFNSGVPVVLTDGQLSTFEGCATISDSSGNLLFYTNGVSVWDSTHAIMGNGTGLAGNSSSTQSAIIVQKPNNVNQYYIFTVDENPSAITTKGGIDYSIVDMTLNGNLGSVITKNIPLLANGYEKITAVKSINNNDFWILTFVRNRFYAWLLDATGINPPIITTSGISSVNNASRGYLKTSIDGSKIASANLGNTPSMFLYDFNTSTGAVSNEQQLFFENTKDNPYGVEFSPLTQKLYVTTCQINSAGFGFLPGGKLYQFDLLNSNLRVKIDDQNTYSRNALQLAIDGKIYRALSKVTSAQNTASGSNYLGVINNPELNGLACNYIAEAIDVTIGGTFPNHKVFEGLPPFVTSLFLPSSITANNVCFENPTIFSLSSIPPSSTIIWNFGDPSTGTNNTSTLVNPTHIYSSLGNFTANVDITTGGTTETLTVDVTVYAVPKFDLLTSVDFCVSAINPTITIENPTDSYTYSWKNELGTIIGNTPEITVNSSGVYTVIATDTNGNNCQSTKSIVVAINNFPVATSPVTLIQCDDDLDGIVNFNLEQANSLISSESPAPTITFFLSEAEAIANSTSIASPVSFSNATTSTVWARIENAIDCFKTAQINLQVASTSIPSNLMVTFNQCDNSNDGDQTNGITTFDFSSATTQVLNALLPETNLTVAYYENIPDALAEQNSLDPTNYRNSISPITQQIVVRVDNLTNDCFGLGYHITLNVNIVPEFDLLTSVEFCENAVNPTITIENPTDSYNYSWKNELGTIIGNTPKITVNSSGVYTVIATDTNGNNCQSTKSIVVAINNFPVATSPVTLIQCDDDLDGIVNFNLEQANSLISSESPAPTITFFLSEAEAIANSTSIASPVSFSNATTSTVWARIENAIDCFKTAQVNLQVTSTNIPSSLMITFNQCDNSNDGDQTNGITTFDFSSATTQVLNALLPETNLTVAYYENIPDALAEQNSLDPTNYRNSISPITQQIVVRVDNLTNDCFGLGYHITLNVNIVPKFDLLTSVEFCVSAVNPTITIENPTDSYNYSWKNDLGIVIGNTPEITINSSGVYTVTATDTNGNNCQSTKSIVVNNSEILPLLDFDISNILITDNSSNNTITILISNLPISTYEFALDNGEFQQNNFFQNILEGLHNVIIRDLENCLETSIEISLINIPNFFTPNNDGYNDTWHVTGIEFQPTSKVYIFDRFGKLIVKLNPLLAGWDGYYKGNPLPSTDYWYKVELEDGRVLKGHFSLIRR